MIQKIDNLKKGDLVVIESSGYLKRWETAVFLEARLDKATVISIRFWELEGQSNQINTRNSTQQRVYKITEDNLTQPLLNSYKEILKNLGL